MKARSKKVGVIGIVAIVLLIAITLVVDISCGTYASLITLYFRGGNVETNYSVSRADAYKASGDSTRSRKPRSTGCSCSSIPRVSRWTAVSATPGSPCPS